MKSNILCLSGYLVALAVTVILPASAATGTAFVQNPSTLEEQNPTAISQLKPVYSCYLRHEALEGRVVVSFTVNSQGDVVNPAIVSSTNRLFEKPTLYAVAHWKFKPAIRGGLPVNRTVTQQVNFEILDAPR
jgi:protein TonB